MARAHLEKLALVGDFVTLLCCLGFGPLLALLSAIGAGFLLRDEVLAPLLVAFLLLGLAGLWTSRRRHCGRGPLALHAASGLAVVAFTFVAFVPTLVWIAFAGLVSATVWDLLLTRRRASAKG
jgi:mercuric ion transport protein